MTQAEEIIKHTIFLEGRYVNDPDDRGGETKYGITKKTYPTIDIARLTPKDAIKIYKRDFWDKAHIDLLHSAKVAQKVFDMCVNMGIVPVIRILQEVVGAKVDGIIGNETAERVNNTDEQIVINGLRKKQLLYYAAIVKADQTQLKFLTGWINRAFAI